MIKIRFNQWRKSRHRRHVQCHAACQMLHIATEKLIPVLQAEQVAREPATPDIRLMRDFADMRPVDIARAYGYQRIAALLDPGRPVQLLAYITSGEAMISRVVRQVLPIRIICSVRRMDCQHVSALVCPGAARAAGPRQTN
jgi:methylphosphotriester-DNA--protein-cysteine methyltransferase